MYQILPYSHEQARKLGVIIRPSTNPAKKIDVYRADQKVASIGAAGYKDYPTFMKEDGKVMAEQRRKAYHQRHHKDKQKIGSAGYYAAMILW
jgi:hypothetical protein